MRLRLRLRLRLRRRSARLRGCGFPRGTAGRPSPRPREDRASRVGGDEVRAVAAETGVEVNANAVLGGCHDPRASRGGRASPRRPGADGADDGYGYGWGCGYGYSWRLRPRLTAAVYGSGLRQRPAAAAARATSPSPRRFAFAGFVSRSPSAWERGESGCSSARRAAQTSRRVGTVSAPSEPGAEISSTYPASSIHSRAERSPMPACASVSAWRRTSVGDNCVSPGRNAHSGFRRLVEEVHRKNCTGIVAS